MSRPEPPLSQRHDFPWLRILTIVAVMTIVVSVFWIVIRQVDDTDVGNLDPTAEIASPDASPPGTPGTPGSATPPAGSTPGAEDGPDWPEGSLPDLLTHAPDRLADDSLPLNDVAEYADIEGWMSARAVPTPTSLVDPELAVWEAELDSLAIPPSLRERGLDPAWQSAYGFNLTQVGQVLMIGQAPDYVMILRGSFDPQVLQSTWVASGYQAIEVEGVTVWSLVPGDTIDLSAPASRPAMGTLNNVVLLEDGTLVAAAKTSRIGSTLDVVNGNAPSLAENDDIAALLLPETGAERLVSAVISKGSLLQATGAAMPGTLPATPAPEPGSIGTPEAEDRMPEVNIMLLGMPLPPPPVTATPVTGEKNTAVLTLLMVIDDVADALVAEEMIRLRLQLDTSPVTGEPYSTRIQEPLVAVLDGDDRAVIMVTGTLANGPADWLEILDSRDLGFAAWLPEE